MQSTSSSASFRASLPDYFLLGLLVFILATIIQLLLPFAGALLLAIVAGVMFYPFHVRLSRYLPRRSPAARALISDGLVLLLFIVPLVLIVWSIVNEAQELSPSLKQWSTTLATFRAGGADAFAPVHRLREWLTSNLGVQPEQISAKMGGMADTVIQSISHSGAAFAKNSVEVILELFIIVFSLFFIFRDGVKMSERFQSYIPLRSELKRELMDRMQNTIAGVMRGMFLTSMVQGLTASIGYMIVGVPAIALLGFLTAIAGLVPSVGTTLVWLPLGICYIVKHAYFKGFFILAWGVFVVGLLDNVLRPYFMKGKSELPFLALFFALLGGIEVWGFKGILLGPLLMSIFPVLLEAYRKRYLAENDTLTHK